jgi:predicted RNA binding protein YcfA (HicA-like mRNA interferase family)
VPQFPSLKARQLRRVLEREPFCYEIARQKGSHVFLESPNGYPRLLFAFHDSDTLSPGIVRKILTKDLPLTDEEALGLL